MAKQVKSKQVAKKQPGKAKVVEKKVSPFEFESVTENLSDRQKLFCMLYAGECKLNGAEAAKKAGYSENGAKEQAARLLTYANVNSFIAELKKDLGLRIGVTAEDIAKEYAEIAFSKITDVIGEGNQVLDVTKIGDKSKLVLSVKNTTTETEHGSKTITEVKLHDKLGALDKLAKMIGVDGVTKVANTDPDGNPATNPLEKLIEAGGKIVING